MLHLKPTIIGLTMAEVREVENRYKQRQKLRASDVAHSEPLTSRKSKEASSTSSATVIGPSSLGNADPFVPSSRLEDIAPSTELFSQPPRRLPRLDRVAVQEEESNSVKANQPLIKQITPECEHPAEVDQLEDFFGADQVETQDSLSSLQHRSETPRHTPILPPPFDHRPRHVSGASITLVSSRRAITIYFSR
jgi:hypothetical protein